ncbi:Clp protease N-terminal domain-containing protein [Fredinandcohnia humi]
MKSQRATFFGTEHLLVGLVQDKEGSGSIIIV